MWAPPEAGLGLGVVQAGADFGFQVHTGAPGQRPGWHIEFDVVGAQFLLIGRIRDRVQHEPIRHGGLIVGVDQVAFDLHAGEWPVGVEPGLGKHRLEDVQTQLHLAPVFAAVSVVVRGALDLFAHKADGTGLRSVTQVRRLPGVSDLTPGERSWPIIRRRHRPGHHQHPVHDLRPRRCRGGSPPARARADPAPRRLGRARPGRNLGAYLLGADVGAEPSRSCSERHCSAGNHESA